MSDFVVRDARAVDLDAINQIYNHEVTTGTSTFDTEPMSKEARHAWLEVHSRPNRPALVAAEDDVVLGWATLSAWSDRCAYARAAEVSIYVHHDHRRRGVGRALLAALIERGRAADLGVLLARIAGEGGASLRLHEEAGFHRFATMRRVGEKFGHIMDVQLLDLHLDQ